MQVQLIILAAPQLKDRKKGPRLEGLAASGSDYLAVSWPAGAKVPAKPGDVCTVEAGYLAPRRPGDFPTLWVR